MFKGGNRKQQQRESVRPRKVQPTVDASFRRNVAFVSKSQREKADQHRTVTERQLLQKRQQAHRRIKIRAALFAVAGILVVAGFVLRVQTVAIRSNASSKLSGEEAAMYQKNIQTEALQHTIASQSWLLDEDMLAQAIYRQFPEIADITFSKKAPLQRDLIATIRFRTPVFTWVDAQNVRQYVDAEGVLFTKNLDPSVQDASLATIEDQSGVVLAAGDTVLTKEIITFIGGLHKRLPPLYGGASIEKVMIPAATREVQVKMANKPYTIKFSSSRSLDEQVGELQTLLQYLEGSGVRPGATVDMRVAHKAFYR